MPINSSAALVARARSFSCTKRSRMWSSMTSAMKPSSAPRQAVACATRPNWSRRLQEPAGSPPPVRECDQVASAA